jgi:hypothetical protein
MVADLGGDTAVVAPGNSAGDAHEYEFLIGCVHPRLTLALLPPRQKALRKPLADIGVVSEDQATQWV